MRRSGHSHGSGWTGTSAGWLRCLPCAPFSQAQHTARAITRGFDTRYAADTLSSARKRIAGHSRRPGSGCIRAFQRRSRAAASNGSLPQVRRAFATKRRIVAHPAHWAPSLQAAHPPMFCNGSFTEMPVLEDDGGPRPMRMGTIPTLSHYDWATV